MACGDDADYRVKLMDVNLSQNTQSESKPQRLRGSRDSVEKMTGPTGKSGT